MVKNNSKFVAEALFRLPPALPPTGWWGHIPFLFALFEATKPKNFVELGVHHGASFMAACQASRDSGSETQLFGVDTWAGDGHVGDYAGDALMKSVREVCAKTGSNFTLMRMTFKEALENFEDGSVEILHIDGYHTYEAVSDDFYSWLPKMSKNGIVLFHDIHEKKDDFGVYKLWSELSGKYRHLDFNHSHGLGVLMLNSDENRLGDFKSLEKAGADREFMRTLIENIAHETVRRTIAGESSVQASLDAVLKSRTWRYTSGIRKLLGKF